MLNRQVSFFLWISIYICICWTYSAGVFNYSRLFIKETGEPRGARPTKAYDVTIQRYRNTHAKIENSGMHILRCWSSKFEISKGTFEISHKILNTYTEKYAFYEVLKNWQLTMS